MVNTSDDDDDDGGGDNSSDEWEGEVVSDTTPNNPNCNLKVLTWYVWDMVHKRFSCSAELYLS